MNLASRVAEMVPRTFVQNGEEGWFEVHGSLAARHREAQKEQELQSTLYDPDGDNAVADEKDLQALLRAGEIDAHDFDWS